MLGRDDGSRLPRIGTILVLALLLGIEEALAADSADSSDRALESAAAGLPPGVGRAIRAAAEKLASPACREIFSDFRDADGRTLQQNLDALGQSGRGFLGLAVFYEGRGKRACAPRTVVAWTNPGSRAIFVCTDQFSAMERHDLGLAADLIIHEELHSLGLGENPPDGKVITAQVIARCGK